VRTLFIVIGFLIYQLSPAQDTTAVSMPAVGSSIEVKPQFPGGIQAFYSYIAKNYNKPKAAGNASGKVYVTFVIEKDGHIDDIKVIRDIGFGTAEEAIRVLKECPLWTPGQQNGRAVRVQYSLPIVLN